LLNIAQLHRETGDHATKNFGEIATVLLPRQLGAELVVVDDELGAKLARARGCRRSGRSAGLRQRRAEQGRRRIDVSSATRAIRAGDHPFRFAILSALEPR
jgi:hypothetical protein